MKYFVELSNLLPSTPCGLLCEVFECHDTSWARRNQYETNRGFIARDGRIKAFDNWQDDIGYGVDL